MYRVKKFHQYLLGRVFVVFSDHKPLQYLFSKSRQVPPMASSRIQRWALTLGAYNYKMVFRAGKLQANADALSRLPLRGPELDVPTPGDTVLMLQTLDQDNSAASVASLQNWIDKDPLISRVREAVSQGDWKEVPNGTETSQYKMKSHELSVQDDCLLMGNRVVVNHVVVSRAGREAIMWILYEGHPGMSRMKSLARCGVVAWRGRRFGEPCKKMPTMPSKQKEPPSGSPASVGMASNTMVSTPH